ncbi:hypothetical protein ACFQY4_02405 [Catellatospora bangladeshensis]|uniref:Prevent-host-death family protein n=1 Tax=Catellatospora bangladeshensis TaxID=310355 RepID=A0A8J3JJ57_9ACTN|nr:hypothetical protein [Catellatospora bangladeshensis]GIF79518.1 hypothetical protein Cba03nite_08670 [Catellatospora bangladeshensis]
MTAVPLESVAFSELLREPTATADRLSRVRAVRLRRRDADDLVLMSAQRAEQEGEVIDLTARLLAELARHDPGIVTGVLPRVLPWVRFLPDAAVSELAEEFVSTAQAVVAVGNTTALSVLLAAWRHTAEAYSDPELHAILTAPTSGDHGPVPLPEVA